MDLDMLPSTGPLSTVFHEGIGVLTREGITLQLLAREDGARRNRAWRRFLDRWAFEIDKMVP